MAEPTGLLVVPAAFRSDGTLRALELTDDDELKVALAAAADGLVGIHGWYSSAWQKAPIPFGVSSLYVNRPMDDSLSSGTNTLTGTAVSAGEIVVLTQFSVRYIGTPPTNFHMRYDVGGKTITIETVSAITSGEWIGRQGWWIMEEGDAPTTKVTGATAGDSLQMSVAGFRIDLDQ